MCDEMNAADKLEHSFVCQGIFERRKTQYVMLFFFLAAIGICGTAVAVEPHDRRLLLVIPILLEIPIYLSWLYQTRKIFHLDDKRRELLGQVTNDTGIRWQDTLGQMIFDFLIIPIPYVLLVAAYVLESKKFFNNYIWKALWHPEWHTTSPEYKLIYASAIVALAISLIAAIYCYLARWFDKRKCSKSRRT